MSTGNNDLPVQLYTIDDYIHAATRDNTRKTYQSAVEHFEVAFSGKLPTTPDTVCRYLSHFASSLSFNTLKTRLAALAQWHQAQGFVDPTKSPQVKKLLKGIRVLHPAPVKKARPLDISELRQLDTHLLTEIDSDDITVRLRALRDRALIWVGFWQGFRSDELSRLRIEHIENSSAQVLTLYLPQSKGDRHLMGKHYVLPQLQALCPANALKDWLTMLPPDQGAVFPSINRWGHLGTDAIHPGSIGKILQTRIDRAGIDNAMSFSSHSLRLGFAFWAASQHWSVSELMQYVGWKDPHTAMAYLESVRPKF
ncbi:hypothetical protein BM528_01650 [Alteromonas sp. RW2A1]|jgi:integrase|uniref:site-specific integrase n=1 Tax=Alteromonas sp. RW2A1 TaxID=1917158 RepID=UPI0009039B21|nr:site-specific integrase [Alteromonas sp. RW2A1]APE04643.1 hypothetical protein BM528_01650 [Alteromonas sp. RW2A1]